jgi:hypothetical protein
MIQRDGNPVGSRIGWTVETNGFGADHEQHSLASNWAEVSMLSDHLRE